VAQALTPARAGAVVALLALVAGTATLNRDLVGVFYDDGLYAGLAWAIAHGHGFAYPNLPGMPAAVHYPPLYPVVLAPLFAFLSVPAAAFAGKLLNVLCWAGASGLIAYHAVRTELVGAGTPVWLTAGIVGCAAVAIPSLTVLTVLLSEPLFAVLVVTAIMLADRPPPTLHPDVAALLAGSAAALALLVRSIGIAIGFAVLVRVYLDARAHGGSVALRHGGLAAAPIAAAVVGWGGWVMAHHGDVDPLIAPDYGSYFEVLRGTGIAGLGTSLGDLARPLGVLTLGWVPSRALYLVCGIPALAVGLCGLVRCARRSSIGIALIAYLAILASWPVPPDRFLWAVLPWLALAWGAGAAGLWTRASAWRRGLVGAPVLVLAAILVLGYAEYELRGFRGRWWALAGHRISVTFTGVLPVLDSLPPAAVIATDQDPLVWLYTRRAAVPFSLYAFQGRAVLEPPPAVHRAYLERQGVTHILVADARIQGVTELDRMRRAYPGWLRVVRRWPDDVTLLQVSRDQ
jgi:hypothetical protein